jgi:transposase
VSRKFITEIVAKRIFDMHLAGMSANEIAKRLQCSPSPILRVIREYKGKL